MVRLAPKEFELPPPGEMKTAPPAKFFPPAEKVEPKKVEKSFFTESYSPEAAPLPKAISAADVSVWMISALLIAVIALLAAATFWRKQR